jgi:4-amino-4-deoxy-L-arabinose transferase-like glycosyltransferase
MFLWLLLFNQWKRLRPLHLPSGIALFLVIAVPWHVLAALRNPTWVHRYVVYEHFERYLTPAAGRVQPWWFFAPILVLGLFPWMGFLWGAVRDALPGGWGRRNENADAWFLVTWIGFIFLFFSASSSKLPAYILPVFPALALLIGAWLANIAADSARLRSGFRVFSFVCGLLALALLVAVFRIGIIRDQEQALELRPFAVALAVILIVGGVAASWLAMVRGARTGFTAMVATSVLFLAGVAWARPAIAKPGTKALALIVKAAARPGDRVMHYFDFFHDFTFYAGRTVELVAGDKNAAKLEFSELEFKEDPAAVARGQLMSETKFHEVWAQPVRIFLVAKKNDVRLPRADGKRPLLEDPTFHYHLLGETRDHYLISNQP